MKSTLSLLLLLVGLACHPDARAVACGDTITKDTILAGDLSCSSGAYALYVATPGITIDFNGYSVSGPATMDGVRVANASDVSLLYGNFTGFRVGVNATRADRLSVIGNFMFEMGTAVIANDSRAVTLVDNTGHTFEHWGFLLAAYRGSRASLGGHTIAGNYLVGSSAMIGVCGHANGRSIVSNNQLFGGSVHLLDGASGNEVSGNAMEGGDTPDPAILLRGSRKNRVINNFVLQYGRGISLVPTYTGTCMTGPLPLPEVSDNVVSGNQVTFGQIALVLGNGNRRLPLVFDNRIQDNTVASFEIGLYLRADSFGNVVSGNSFFNTRRSLRNEGFLNLLPGTSFRGGPGRVSVRPAAKSAPSLAQARAHAAGTRPRTKDRTPSATPVGQPRPSVRGNKPLRDTRATIRR